MKIKTAMLFAAGLGTRLKPFTDHHPKALAKVNGVPLLEHNLNYLKHYGIERVIVNIHHYGNQIVDYIQNSNFAMEIVISDETNEVLETGGGLVKAKNLLGNDPFVVMNVDILTNLNLKNFMDYYRSRQSLALLAITDRDSSRKLFFDKNKQLIGWKNFNTSETVGQTINGESFAFSGIHIIDPKIFDFIEEKGKFSIITTYLNLMKSQHILGFNHSGDLLIDVGKPEAIVEAEKYF